MADITRKILTNSDCYKRHQKMRPKGVLWHSTGANNPFLSRYLGTDEKLGVNKNNNDWNRPMSRKVMVHAWIGYLKDKIGVATYQSLPWEYVGWHSGKGRNGSANYLGYIGFEICEDSLDDENYFKECYKQGIELTAHLLKTYGLPVTSTTVIDHAQGARMGIASNHSDTQHWMKKFGLTMDDVRRDVKALMSGNEMQIETPGLIRKNSRGPHVKELQENLIRLGYNLGKYGADGIAGDETIQAIRSFQASYKLSVDGIAGQATLGLVKELIKALDDAFNNATNKNDKGEIELTEKEVVELVGKMIRPSSDTKDSSHWGNTSYEHLREKGLIIYDKRFDDITTRAEAYTLIDRTLDTVDLKIEKLENEIKELKSKIKQTK